MAIDWTNSPGLRGKIRDLLGFAAMGRDLQALGEESDADPVDNTDLAPHNGALLLRGDESDVFVAHTVTSTTTTWVKIVD